MKALLPLLLVLTLVAGCTNQPSGKQADSDVWEATYDVAVYGLMHLSGKPEPTGHRVDVTLEGSLGFTHTLHLQHDLTLLRQDEPCSFDHQQQCERAAYDATLRGYPPGFGLFLLLLNETPNYTIATGSDGTTQVTSPLPAQIRGALGPATLHYSPEAPIPRKFSITIPNEVLEATLVDAKGDFPTPKAGFKPTPTAGNPENFAYPGSDQDFLNLGVSPDAMLTGLTTQQPQARAQRESGACLRSMTIFINPTASTIPQTGAIEIYRAIATLENTDGTAVTWDFQAFPLAGQAVITTSTSQPADAASICLAARAHQMTYPANEFWVAATARDHRGQPTSFHVDAQAPIIGEYRAGTPELHYGAQYIPPDTFFGSFPNTYLIAATDGRLLFLETDLQEPAPDL